jgi:uncharacterized protein YgiM (DUF1202 family)
MPYLIKVSVDILNVRSGPGTGYRINTQVKKNQVYTIIDEKNGWGKLKSGAGWIALDYTDRQTSGKVPVENKPAKKSNEEIANEVIRGEWGNGQERKDRLTKAGYNYSEIQTIVNKKMK